MKRRFAVLTLWVLGCLVAMGNSCTIQDIEGSGKSGVLEQDVAAFDRVANTTQIEMLVVSGTVPHVKLTCDDNLLDHFCVVVEDGLLGFKTARTDPTVIVNLRPRTRCLVEVTATGPLVALTNTGSARLVSLVPLVEHTNIALTGSGDIEASAIAAADLEASLTGSGDLLLEGTTELLELTLTGSGNVLAHNLIAQNAHVVVSGSGNSAIQVQQCVDVTITGSGNVCVEGQPEVCGLSTPGSGRVSFE